MSISECLLSCETKDILLPRLLNSVILDFCTTVSYKTVLEMNLQYKVFKRNKCSQNIQGRWWQYFVLVKRTQRKQEVGFELKGERFLGRLNIEL